MRGTQVAAEKCQRICRPTTAAQDEHVRTGIVMAPMGPHEPP